MRSLTFACMGRPVENVVLAESAVLAAPLGTAGKGVWRSRLIEADVEGSSGFYPAEVLRRDGPGAFPAGTHVYMDHPTKSEEDERPERSVYEMAGVLLDDASFEEGVDGRGLFARVQFFQDVKDLIQTRAKHVGLSIRAGGVVEETPQGRVVRSIRKGISVDVVTRAGAGGRLVTMTESKTETVQTGTSSSGGTSQGADTGTLIAEVVAMRESQDRLTLAFTKLTQLLKDRQKEADRQMQESLSVGKVVAKLMEADLPNSSRARLAENYRPGQDLDDSVRKEREYLKSVMAESRTKSGKKEESSGLGLTESVSSMDHGGGTADFNDIEAVLNGKLF